MMDEKEVTTTTRTRRAKRKSKWDIGPGGKRMYKRTMFYTGVRAPVPYKLMTSMLYQERVTLSPLAGVQSVHVFSANGTYDPNITGVGHQPRGFDQLMALYDHNVVIMSEIVVDYPSLTVGANVNPTTCYIAALDQAGIPASERDYLELSNCVWRSRNPSDAPVRLRAKVNPNKYLTRASPLSDPNLKNSASNNPAEQVFWHVGAAAASGLDPSPISVNVVIKYTCIFLEPKDPGQS